MTASALKDGRFWPRPAVNRTRQLGKPNEHLHGWSGLRRPGVGGLLFRVRLVGHLHRQGRGSGRGAEARRGADLRAGARRSAGAQHGGEAAVVQPRSGEGGGRGGPGVPRRRHADAPRRRPCRPVVRVRRRRGDRAASVRLHRHHHQVDRAGRHQPRDRAPVERSFGPTPISRSAPIRSSCARARRSRTSPIPTVCWSAATSRGRARSWSGCTSRSPCATRR